jgi:UDPglucose--hexose-1-phosphate uridylyltransferase
MPGSRSVRRLGRASQARRDAINGRWVIFAPGRSERPAEIFEAELPMPAGHACPFCAGNESHTPPASYSVRDPQADELPWIVRVVPNLFPAVSSNHPPCDGTFPPVATDRDATANRHFGAASYQHLVREGSIHSQMVGDSQTGTGEDRPWESLAAARSDWTSENGGNPPQSALPSPSRELFEYCELHGGHEVIVETPDHVESLTSLTESHAAQVFCAYADRIRHWLRVPGVRYVVVFKNAGAAAGASLRHTHSQLIATSLLPPAMQEIGERMQQHTKSTGGCLLCDMVAGELEDESRVISASGRYVAFCPFASRLPYLVRVVPRNHADRFELCSAEALAELSNLTQEIVRSLESMFVACAYNYTIHTRPPGVADRSSFHWWMEIFPRLTKVAGFEWGSDCYINPVTPEVAAEHLRGGPNYSG